MDSLFFSRLKAPPRSSSPLTMRPTIHLPPRPAGHETPAREKTYAGTAAAEIPETSPLLHMAELAKEIIRQQWPLRHHADPLRRAQARTLIRTHILLLRKWRRTPATTAEAG